MSNEMSLGALIMTYISRALLRATWRLSYFIYLAYGDIKNNEPSRESNLGPFNHDLSALPVEQGCNPN